MQEKAHVHEFIKRVPGPVCQIISTNLLEVQVLYNNNASIM